MPRQILDAQQPPNARRPVRKKKKKEPSVGTMLRPYVRDDGVETVKISFRGSKQCAMQLQALANTLLVEGIQRNEWLEDLVFHGIETGYRPKPEAAE